MGELGLERGLEINSPGLCRQNKVAPSIAKPPCISLAVRSTAGLPLRKPTGSDQLPARRGDPVLMAFTATGANLPMAGARHSIWNGHFESTWSFKGTEQRAAVTFSRDLCEAMPTASRRTRPIYECGWGDAACAGLSPRSDGCARGSRGTGGRLPRVCGRRHRRGRSAAPAPRARDH
jgi:hypothetical protein